MNVRDLLKLDVISIDTELSNKEFGHSFNWLLLFEVSYNSSMRVSIEDREKKLWAKVAICAASRMLDNAYNIRLRVMQVVAGQLSVFGCFHVFFGYSIESLCDWFLDDLPCESPLNLNARWLNSEFYAEELKRMRAIKNKINIMMLIDNSCYQKKYPKVIEWIKYKDRLP